eukprot:g4756.t1
MLPRNDDVDERTPISFNEICGSGSGFSKLYRSAEMKHVMLFVQVSSAHKLLFRLASLLEGGVMQFDDLNGELTAFQRRYATQIKKCDEMERVLTFFDAQFRDLNVPLPDGDAAAKNFWTRHDAELREFGGVEMNRIVALERTLLKEENVLRQLNEAHNKLLQEFNQCKELRYVLNASLNFKRGMEMGLVVGDDESDDAGLVGGGGRRDVRFNTMMGVINAGADAISFQRMVFRLTRGLAFLEFQKIIDKRTQQPVLFDSGSGGSSSGTSSSSPTSVEKLVFTAIFSGKAIRQKIMQVADAFGAHVHDVADDETRGDIQATLSKIVEKLNETGEIMRKNRNYARGALENIAQKYWQWRLTVKLEKSVYHTLNKCDVQKAGYLVAQGWLLADKFETVANIVQQQEGEGNNLLKKDTKKKPPTYFKSNKFTSTFQAMTDTYGVPRYQEANPTLFSCITFPFLFGVMFGDVGHGTLLLIFAATLVLFEKRLEKFDMGEVGGMLFGGRYMLLLMGFFAVYCGFVYNECFCLALNIFGSNYEKTLDPANETIYVVKDDPDYKLMGPAPVYYFGIDPTWHVSQNELTFVNSFKMKTSVILGVAQMTMGIVIKFTNAFHFKNRNELYFECIPQMCFMCCFFVYMDLLILIKWCTDWTKMDDGVPNLINTMINMPLAMGGRGDEPPTYIAGVQDTLQPILLVVALLSVPMMLIPKPLFDYYDHKREHEARHQHRRPAHVLSTGHSINRGGGGDNKDDDDDDAKRGLITATKEIDADDFRPPARVGDDDFDDEEEDEEEEHTLGDLFIHQAIETIEFVLGCVSNTASYLRLWALSLAHAELAKTFWDLLMANTINMGGGANFIVVFGGYSMWAAVTISVLMCMDSLECFLHALRLHWVEFQHKFYNGDGYAFTPFQFSPSRVVKESKKRAAAM